MKYYTYNELCEIAKLKRIKPNKVMVGIWAKMNGYIKVKQKIINNRQISVYIKSEKNLY